MLGKVRQGRHGRAWFGIAWLSLCFAWRGKAGGADAMLGQARPVIWQGKAGMARWRVAHRCVVRRGQAWQGRRSMEGQVMRRAASLCLSQIGKAGAAGQSRASPHPARRGKAGVVRSVAMSEAGLGEARQARRVASESGRIRRGVVGSGMARQAGRSNAARGLSEYGIALCGHGNAGMSRLGMAAQRRRGVWQRRRGRGAVCYGSSARQAGSGVAWSGADRQGTAVAGSAGLVSAAAVFVSSQRCQAWARQARRVRATCRRASSGAAAQGRLG